MNAGSDSEILSETGTVDGRLFHYTVLGRGRREGFFQWPRAKCHLLKKTALLFPKIYRRSKVARLFGRVEREGSGFHT